MSDTPIDIATLLTPLDPDVTFDTWMQALQDAGVPSDSWVKGGPMRTLMRIIANTIVAMWTVTIAMISGGFLETAFGNWLTLLAYYVYGVTRVPATYAQGFVTLINSGGGLYGPFDPGEFIVYSSTTKATYVNTTTFTLNPGATISALAIIAQVAGSASTSAAGTIDSLQTTLPKVTVTNVADVVGIDAQNDDDLKTLCLNKLGALSLLGPRDAYAYAIRTANDNGAPVNINRRSITRSSSTGIVAIVLASPSGTPSDADVTAVGTNIEAVARPDTATVDLSKATVVASTQDVTVYAVTTAGLDEDSLKTMIQDVVTPQVAEYPISGYTKPPSTQGYLFATDIDGWIKSANAAIYAIDGLVDVAIPAGEVVSLTLNITVRFVASAAA